MHSADTYLIGIDLGGTKVAAALADASGSIIRRIESPTDTSGTSAAIEQIIGIVRELAADSSKRLRGIGIGIPGITDSEAGMVVWAPNLPGWRDIPLGQMISRDFGVPVRMENDVDAAALGEWWRGAARGTKNAVFVAVGTGIGAGLILDGRLYRGSGGVAGAVGWSVVGEDRLFKPEYQEVGCAETLAAGPGIGRRARAAAQPGGLMLDLAGGDVEKIDSRVAFEAARQGDQAAKRVVQETAEVLGIVIANTVSLLNPDVVLIGGGVGQGADLLLDPIREIVKFHAQPVSARHVRIIPAELGPDAGLMGAVYLALDT